jgi:hypothetical protein
MRNVGEQGIPLASLEPNGRRLNRPERDVRLLQLEEALKQALNKFLAVLLHDKPVIDHRSQSDWSVSDSDLDFCPYSRDANQLWQHVQTLLQSKGREPDCIGNVVRLAFKPNVPPAVVDIIVEVGAEQLSRADNWLKNLNSLF